ncbi:MAG: cell division protein ZapA [Flavobacteriales bacterium]
MQGEKIKIKINVAGRLYPLTIKPFEEEAIRVAGKNLNDMIKQFEKNYDVRDKQDVLSMCALMLSSKIELEEFQDRQNDQNEEKKLAKLIELIDQNT